jgi:uncharacterized protein YbjT (DUF2867 family)
MANPILVTGGTGTVGRVVVKHLLDAGRPVRVLSRGRRRPGPAPHVTGDVRSGEGLATAIAGVDTIVCCTDPVNHVVQAARQTGSRPHLVYISIVGVDRVPFGYYRRKLADEQLIRASELPWTVLRTTQFHDLIAAMLRLLAKAPVMVVPAGWSFQPVDVREVGARLSALALGDPGGRVADMGGPEVRTVEDLARIYLAAVGKRRAIWPVSVPGRVSRSLRAGDHLTPRHAAGTVPFAQYLGEQLAAGMVPYNDVIRDYTRRAPRDEVQ